MLTILNIISYYINNIIMLELSKALIMTTEIWIISLFTQ